VRTNVWIERDGRFVLAPDDVRRPVDGGYAAA
jgi:hypothetical protein